MAKKALDVMTVFSIATFVTGGDKDLLSQFMAAYLSVSTPPTCYWQQGRNAAFLNKIPHTPRLNVK